LRVGLTRCIENCAMNVMVPKCVVCGEPADAICSKCGQGYCVRHRGDPQSEDEEEPRVCWNCSQSGNAKAVLFWVALGAAGFVALIIFFLLWS
jgi:hypothetical protein